MLLVKNHERAAVPPMFWPLAAYGVATLAASVFSVDPRVSLVDSKQLVLLVIVPLTYRLFRGRRAFLATDVIITVGALSAAFYALVYLGVTGLAQLLSRQGSADALAQSVESSKSPV